MVAKVAADSWTRNKVVGPFGNGGLYLELLTNKSTKDYSYNREFQRMRYLNEGPVSDESYMSPQLMADLGVDNTSSKSNFVVKEAPHPKYY